MPKETTNMKSEKRVELKIAIEMKDDELEEIVGGTLDGKLVTDFQTGSPRTRATTSGGHYTQVSWAW